MKFELTCNSEGCPSVIPEFQFKHWMLSDSNGACPACGSTDVTVERKTLPDAKIALGQLSVTPGAKPVLGTDGRALLRAHAQGDWGDIDPEDARANERALSWSKDELAEGRVMSVWKRRRGTLWIITERGRHATTIMLPEDY